MALHLNGNEKLEENTVEYDKKMSNIIRDYVLKERATELKFKTELKKQTIKNSGFGSEKTQFSSEAGPAFIPREKI